MTGTVLEVGLFATTLTAPDNVRTMVGNAKIFSDIIQNYSANPYRRVDLMAQLAHGVDPNLAIGLLKERLAKVPNVLTTPPPDLDAIHRLKAVLPTIPNVIAEPKPDVEILTFTERGPVLAVRPYCNNAHYWQVYFDTNRSIREAFGTAGFPAPQQHFRVQSLASTS